MLSLSLPGAVLLASLTTSIQAQVYVGRTFNASTYPPAGISDLCKATYTLPLQCDYMLYSIGYSGHIPTADNLNTLCTASCSDSLQAVQSQQRQHCDSDYFESGDYRYPVTKTIDDLVRTHKFICRKDIADQLCYPKFEAWAKGHANDTACTDCVLGSYQLSLNDSSLWIDAAAAQYSSHTSSCSASGYPVVSPTATRIRLNNFTSTAHAAKATPICHSTYTIAAGDDCHSLSKEFNVSTASLLYMNNLQAGCANFPSTGTKICLPYPCDVHTVQREDNCYSLESKYSSFTKSQLVSWNLDINDGCDNLEMLLGNQICVSYPGKISNITGSVAPASMVAKMPANAANTTNRRCSQYYTVRSEDTCAIVTQAHSISLKDFYFLNPSINSTSCNNLWLGTAYCVRAVSDIRMYPGYDGRSSNECLGAGDVPQNCYATTYPAGPAWEFPMTTMSHSTGYSLGAGLPRQSATSSMSPSLSYASTGRSVSPSRPLISSTATLPSISRISFRASRLHRRAI